MSDIAASESGTERGGAPPGAPLRRPGILTFLLVAALALGAIGVLMGLLGVVQATRSREAVLEQVRRTNEWSQVLTGSELSEETLRIQEAMSVEMAERQLSLRALTIPTWSLDLLLSAGLVAGAILVFRRRETGRRILCAAALGHLVYEVLYAVATVKASAISYEVMERWMPELMASMSTPAGPLGAGSFASTIARASFWAGVAVAIVVALVSAAYYVWLLVYLRGERARAFCRP